MRTTYGFDPNIFSTLEPNAINARIYKAIKDEIPTIDNLQVIGNVAKGDAGTYQVSLNYTVGGVAAPALNLYLSM